MKFLNISMLISVAILLFGVLLSSNQPTLLKMSIKKSFMHELKRTFPPAIGDEIDVIYVLGGAEKSLRFKYSLSAELFGKGVGQKIWILSRQGKTGYNQALQRNLTNDEWSMKMFNRLGVPEENVELIKIEQGFFGTLREAKYISDLLKKRKHEKVLLIAEPHHTRRVKFSFDKFLRASNTQIFIQSSEEKIFLRELIYEYCKLRLYHVIFAVWQ